MPNLIAVAGIPGSGKSTWAKTYLDLKYAVVSSDAIRTRLAGSLRTAHDLKITPWDEFYGDIEDKLRHGVDVLADATFLTRRHRMRALETAWSAGAKAHLVLFKNVMEATVRNAERDEETRVPESAMSGMMTLYYDTLLEILTESWDTVTKIESFK